MTYQMRARIFAVLFLSVIEYMVPYLKRGAGGESPLSSTPPCSLGGLNHRLFISSVSSIERRNVPDVLVEEDLASWGASRDIAPVLVNLGSKCSYIKENVFVHKDPRVLMLIGMDAERNISMDRARDAYSALIALYPWYMWTKWFYDLQARNPDLAKTSEIAALHLLQEDVGSSKTQVALGWFALRKGDYVGAQSLFRPAVRSLPTLSRAWLGLALTEANDGENAEAELDFRRAAYLGVQEVGFNNHLLGGSRSVCLPVPVLPIEEYLLPCSMAYCSCSEQ